MVNTAPPATVSAPEMLPPFQSIMVKALLVGAVRLPELKITWSAVTGTCGGSQLVALFQSVAVEPFHVRVTARTLPLPRPSPTSDKTNADKMRFMVLNPLVEI